MSSGGNEAPVGDFGMFNFVLLPEVNKRPLPFVIPLRACDHRSIANARYSLLLLDPNRNSQLDGYLLGSWRGMTRPGPRGRWDA